jgi:hypothetical protein
MLRSISLLLVDFSLRDGAELDFKAIAEGWCYRAIGIATLEAD